MSSCCNKVRSLAWCVCLVCTVPVMLGNCIADTVHAFLTPDRKKWFEDHATEILAVLNSVLLSHTEHWVTASLNASGAIFSHVYYSRDINETHSTAILHIQDLNNKRNQYEMKAMTGRGSDIVFSVWFVSYLMFMWYKIDSQISELSLTDIVENHPDISFNSTALDVLSGYNCYQSDISEWSWSFALEVFFSAMLYLSVFMLAGAANYRIPKIFPEYYGLAVPQDAFNIVPSVPPQASSGLEHGSLQQPDLADFSGAGAGAGADAGIFISPEILAASPSPRPQTPSHVESPSSQGIKPSDDHIHSPGNVDSQSLVGIETGASLQDNTNVEI